MENVLELLRCWYCGLWTKEEVSKSLILMYEDGDISKSDFSYGMDELNSYENNVVIHGTDGNFRISVYDVDLGIKFQTMEDAKVVRCNLIASMAF